MAGMYLQGWKHLENTTRETEERLKWGQMDDVARLDVGTYWVQL